ncbi:MAG: hypothetical protein LBT20_05965 [Clostridiales bacterium]|jgi:DNA polymerase-3 subunit delta'|nr:hypothetical protein [Clostridiales bacterium]
MFYLESEPVRRFRSQAASGGLKHSYLLVTPSERAAREVFTLFALTVFCKSGKVEPCFSCGECRKVLGGNHSGIFVSEGKFNVADAETMIADLYIKPIDGDNKLYYIGGVDALLPAVQNKLLKSLEEPPEGVIFFLSAKNEDAVLKTVLSRCEKLYLTASDRADAAKILSEEFKGDPFVATAVMLADGFTDNARNMIADVEYRKLYFECIEILNGLKKSGEIIRYLYRPAFEKEHFKDTLNIFEAIINETVQGLAQGDEKRVLIKGAEIAALTRYVYLIMDARKRVFFNTGSISVAENLMMGMLETSYLTKS